MTSPFRLLLVALLFLPISHRAQSSTSDSTALLQLAESFQAAIASKDSNAFQAMFFSPSVSFTGIMSEKTEWSIKKDYAEFQGVSVSNPAKFIRDICLSPKKQREEFFNLRISSDGAIASIHFDYGFYADAELLQWGHEKWNLAKAGSEWLITDVIYSVHFPHVESFPFE